MGNENEIKSIEVYSKLSNFEVINPEFTRCRCNVFYTGRNRNYTDITEDALQKFIARKGYANIPVCGHLYPDPNHPGKMRLGGHDMKIILDENGIEFVDETVPFGVIPEDCNPSIDMVKERSGELKPYFSVDLILWTHRYPEIMEAAFNEETYFNQSMEIKIHSGTYDKDDYYVIDDFSMSALCLLNLSMNKDENVEPCFESSRVKKFSLNEDNFKKDYELLLESLKKFSIDNKPNVTTNKNNSKKEDKTFMNYSEITKVLSTETCEKSGETVARYSLLSATEDKVFALDMTDYKPYSFEYAMIKDEEKNTENLVIDFSSKVEMALSATDKITEEGFKEFTIQTDVIDVLNAEYEKRLNDEADAKTQAYTKSLEEEFNAKFNELKSSYEDLTVSYQAALAKIDKYEEAEKQAAAEAHRAQIDELFETYAEKLSKSSDFLIYKAKTNPDEVSVDEVREKLTLMMGKYIMESQTKQNFAYKPQAVGVTNKKPETDSPYGHLLDKYIK